MKKCTICKAAEEPFIGHEAIECPYIDPVKRNNFTKIYQFECEEDNDNENERFINESALLDMPVTENNDHDIPSLSRAQICQCPTTLL